MRPWPRPRRLRVVGLDLAWSPRNPTGGCVASWDGHVARLAEPPRSDLGSNEEILRYVRQGVGDGVGVVAIDCPLAVPNATGLRECDRQVNRFFRRFEAGVYPANRENLGRYRGLRGVDLARDLEGDGFSLDPRSWAERRVIEVYPHAATVTLFRLRRTLKYKPRPGRGYPERWRELVRLQRHLASLRRAQPPFATDDGVVRTSPKGIRGRALKRMEDALDALVCAYVGLLYGIEGARRCAVFGDRARGHIVVPMTLGFWRASQPTHDREALYFGDSRRRTP